MAAKTGGIHRYHVRGGLLLAATACVLLLACHPASPESPFARYTRKVGIALAVTAPRPTAPPLPAFSGQPQPLTGTNAPLHTIDILSVSGCALQHNLIKRSSSLGRHAKASQRLLIELEFLQLAPACIQRLRQRRDTIHSAALEHAWELARLALPTLIFDATLGSAPFYALWQHRPTPGAYPLVPPRATSVALLEINQLVRRWLRGDYRADNTRVEVLISDVAGGSAGQYLQRLTAQAAWLDAAAEMLQQQCATPAVNDNLLRTVFNYFTRELLPVAATTWRAFDRQLAPLITLEMLLTDALPADYLRWMRAREQRIATIDSAPADHLRRLRGLRTGCSR